MDGLQLCRELRALRNGNACMIFVLTEHEEPQVLKSIIEAGADDYLIIPIHAGEVLKVRLKVPASGATAIIPTESGPESFATQFKPGLKRRNRNGRLLLIR